MQTCREAVSMFDSTKYYFRSQNLGRRSRPLFGVSTGPRSFQLSHVQGAKSAEALRGSTSHAGVNAHPPRVKSESAPIVEHLPRRLQTIRSYDVDARLQDALGSGLPPPSSTGREKRRFVSLHPISVGGVPQSYKQEQRQGVAWAHQRRMI